MVIAIIITLGLFVGFVLCFAGSSIMSFRIQNLRNKYEAKKLKEYYE